MPSSPTCPNCQIEMQEGFIPDRSQAYVAVSGWMAGTPKLHFFGGIRLRKKDLRPIVAYRCPTCGYLKSYAP
jgi:rubredoxin